MSGQLACARMPSPSPPTWPWTSMMPGMIVLPVASMRLAPAGIVTDRLGPIAVIRLPSITIVAFSMTC